MHEPSENDYKKGSWTLSQLFWYVATFFGMFFVALNVSGWIVIGYIVIVIFGPKWSLVPDEQLNYVLTIHWVIMIVGGIILSIEYGGLSWLTADLCGPMVLCGP